jgi:hypothetical protein
MKLKYTKEIVENAVKNNKSMASTIRYLGLDVNGGNHRTLTKYISFYKIDISHFTGQGWSIGQTAENSDIIANANKKRELKNEDVFVENSCTSDSVIRRKVKKYNLIKYACFECGNIGVWKDKQLTLHLDHKNGNHTDNRLENLRYLCPNCHQQTETWGNNSSNLVKCENLNKCSCGANISKKAVNCIKCSNKLKAKIIVNISKDDLIRLLSVNNISKIAKLYNTSRTTIRKLKIKYNLV